jgi:hypothetical protein
MNHKTNKKSAFNEVGLPKTVELLKEEVRDLHLADALNALPARTLGG